MIFVELTQRRQLSAGEWKDADVVPVNGEAIVWLERTAGGTRVHSAAGSIVVRETPDEIRELCGDPVAIQRESDRAIEAVKRKKAKGEGG